MPVAYLDTHVAVWLHASAQAKISREARRVMESHDLLISPMVQLELAMLRQIGRLLHTPERVISGMQSRLGVAVCQLPFALIAAQAAENSWTRDPFDSLIVAQAQANQNARLITADERILEHYSQAIW
jgi:PIN domain nuclease of toxin-antitoxin system